MGRHTRFDTLLRCLEIQYESGGEIYLAPSDVHLLLDSVADLKQAALDAQSAVSEAAVLNLTHVVDMLRGEVSALRSVKRQEIDQGGHSVAMSIIYEVCQQRSVTLAEIMGDLRTRQVTNARRDAMRAVHRKMPHMAVAEIGRIFGVHHTTVLHALGKTHEAKRRETARRARLQIVGGTDAAQS